MLSEVEAPRIRRNDHKPAQEFPFEKPSVVGHYSAPTRKDP